MTKAPHPTATLETTITKMSSRPSTSTKSSSCKQHNTPVHVDNTTDSNWYVPGPGYKVDINTVLLHSKKWGVNISESTYFNLDGVLTTI